jgi:NAD(P)-dependent dehydrogenase (short-subunit alcohol dehydrogenase family)
MGKLWAEAFAADGARVALWDLDDAALAQTAAEFRAKGWPVHTQNVDVSRRSRVYAAATQLAADYGPVDVLVNNAGIVAGGKFLETKDERLEATIDVDLKALMWTCKAFLPGMIERGEGHVVNVSSASGFIGVPFLSAYAAAKWGVLGLTDSLRLEMQLLGHKGIGFTVFCPSYVDTGMFQGVKAPLFTPLLTPAVAVQRGYAAFRRGVYVVKEPFLVKLTPALQALLPTPVFDTISSLLHVNTSMEAWKGHGA